MAGDLTDNPRYRTTMDALEDVKRATGDGREYWLAREINGLLGYPHWREFEVLTQRAKSALSTNDIDPSHHFAGTHKMVELGSGSQRRIDDLFLSRLACYLIAMNGDPAKPEIAAAQAYFVVQTRTREIEVEISDDEKRLQLRDKVKQSFKRVSGVAADAGVRSSKQAFFHDARYQGLYGMSLKDLKALKRIGDKEQLFDRAGPLELSANDFQMNLAANVIIQEKIKGETNCIATNKSVARRVRKTIEESGATLPEKLPLEPPIKELEKRARKQLKSKAPPSSGS